MNKRRKWAIFFLVLGLVCILYPYFMHEKQGEEIEQLQVALEEIEMTGETNSDFVKDDLLNTMRLSIPAIELNSTVLPKTTKEYLNISLTQIKQNQVPGEGNFTIAGHNSSVFGRHFNRLHELTIGDEIQLIDGENVYTYVVESKTVIAATQVEVLDDTPGKNEITLITCTDSGKKRLAIKGNRIS